MNSMRNRKIGFTDTDRNDDDAIKEGRNDNVSSVSALCGV